MKRRWDETWAVCYLHLDDLAALKFCKTCVAMKFVDDDDDDSAVHMSDWVLPAALAWPRVTAGIAHFHKTYTNKHAIVQTNYHWFALDLWFHNSSISHPCCMRREINCRHVLHAVNSSLQILRHASFYLLYETVTVLVILSGFNSRYRTFISVCSQPATQGQLSL